MNPEAQRQIVLDHLARREQIASETLAQLHERREPDPIDPLAQIDQAVREAAEDEFYAAQGRRRYKTHDGRILFLTPEEIAQRRRVRTERGRARGRYYGPGAEEQRRRLLTWGFNIGAVVLALVIVFLILH
ncbi:MAG TPA: hypothetical protein PKA64_10675 [Myxococcota bacterium]|nr:hypothetical protein [Myxococcota bacterium]